MMLRNFIAFLFVDERVKQGILFLNKVNEFKMFSPWELKKIIMILYKRTYIKNEIIYKKNEQANLVCLLGSGKIELDNGTTKSYVEPNTLFGKKHLFLEDDFYLNTAKAVEKSELFFIHKDDLEDLMIKDKNIGFKITKVLLENFYNRA